MNNFRTPYALYGHLQHQKSTYMGPESPKSIHKFLLPENAFIIDFRDLEMPLKCPKVELRGQKPQNFEKRFKHHNFWWKTVFWYVLVCCLHKTCIQVSFFIYCWFYVKKWPFFKIFPFFGLFSPRWSVKKIFGQK